MRYTLKKTTAFLLVLVMLVNIFPLSVFAAGGNTGEVEPAGLPSSYSVKLDVEDGIEYVPQGYYVIAFNPSGIAILSAELSYAPDRTELSFDSLNGQQQANLGSGYSYIVVKPNTQYYRLDDDWRGTSLSSAKTQSKYDVLTGDGMLDGLYFAWSDTSTSNGIITLSVANEAPTKATRDASNVTVTVEATNIDLSADGSRYYIVVGSNDDIAPYQHQEITASSPAGTYEFNVARLNEVDTLFVVLKRYESGETPTPDENGNDVVFNLNTSNTIAVGTDDYDFTWEKEENQYNYTIRIRKENNQQGGDEPTVHEGHAAVIKTGKGVTFADND